jgi:CRP-like cAMP-binding protein
MTHLAVVSADQDEDAAWPRPLQVLRLRASESVPLPADHLWIVASGLIVTCTSYQSGDVALLGLLGPSDPLGHPLTEVEPYGAIALTPVQLAAYRRSSVGQQAALAQHLLQAIARRQRQREALLAARGERRIEDRLRVLLQLLAQDFGETSDAGTRLQIRLTHQQLADLLGTTRVTVTQVLNSWLADGYLLRTQDRHHVVPAA